MSTLRSTLLALTCLALLPLPSTAVAGIVFLPSGGKVLTDPGESRIQQLPTGLFRITTVGLTSTAVIDCTGNAQCQSTDLDGEIIDIDEDLRIAIDFTGAGVTGEFRGVIFLPAGGRITLPDMARFRGDIEGRAQCLPVGGQACPRARFNLYAVAPLRDQASDALIGNVTWQLEGVFERSSTGSSGDWTSLGGEGGLTVIFEE